MDNDNIYIYGYIIQYNIWYRICPSWVEYKPICFLYAYINIDIYILKNVFMNIRVAKMFIEKVLHFTPSTNKVVFLWLTLLYPAYNWGCNPLRIPRVNHGNIIKPSIIYI